MTSRLQHQFQHLPIRKKLIAIIIFIAAMAMLISSLVENVLNWTAEKQMLAQRLNVMTEVVSRQLAASVEFLDPVAAKENIRSLEVDPMVKQACVYDSNDILFLKFSSTSKISCPKPQNSGYYFELKQLHLFQPIQQDNRAIGTLYITYSLDLIYDRFTRQIMYKIAIVLLLLLILWPVSNYFQRIISRPIVRLAESANHFSLDRSTKIDKEETRNDEIGDLVNAFYDMTNEIRQNEHKLEQTVDTLSRTNKELERFAYICSHDLRSPLVNLRGFSGEMSYALGIVKPFIQDALKTLQPDNRNAIELAIEQDIPEALGFINSSVERMDRLTAAILELSRIGRRELHFVMQDTNAIVKRCLESSQHVISSKKVIIDKKGLPNVKADPVALEQIFANIIDNALKYLDTQRVGKVEIGGQLKQGYTLFWVKDNGRGIKTTSHQKVFEIFQRAGNNEAIPGEGMGMPYVKAMLHRHNGDIWFESEPGKGTTFYFTISHNLNIGEA